MYINVHVGIAFFKYVNQYGIMFVSNACSHFTSIKLLFYHLRTAGTKTKIICGQKGCTHHVYHYGFSYKRHLNRDHAPQNELHVASDNDMLEDEVEKENEVKKENEV